MSQWNVLDLSEDPTPGDPHRARALAQKLLGEAESVENNTSRLRSVTTDSDALRMEGDYAPAFREVLSELPGELAKLGKAYRRCGDALSAFATSLADAKSQSGNALRQGQDAQNTIQGALRQIRAALPADRAAMVSDRRVPTEFALDAAIADLDEGTKAQARAALRRAQYADQDRARARRLATDAARLRGDAEDTCVEGIQDALNDTGIKNKEWWEKAWDAVSAPFRSWDAFVDLCKNVAMVAGVVALFISGPIGLALVAVALVAGAVIFADTLSKYARGEATLGALAMDALGLIPGARGVTSLAKLGRSAAGLANGVRTGGRAIVSGLRNAPGSIRSCITNLRRSGRPAGARPSCLEPIDPATGEMFHQHTDVELPGILPLVLSRTHVSSYRAGRWFGPSWASTLDQRLEVDPTSVCHAADDGMLLVYPVPANTPVLPEEGPRRPLALTEDGGYTLTDPDSGQTLHFAPPGQGVVAPLIAISDRNGHRIDLGYDPDGTLVQIRHSGGYRIAVETSGGLITALRLQGSDNGTGDVTLLRYRYDHARRLTDVINSSDLPLRFEYDTEGRVTRWIDRNDSWYAYTYDDAGRCVRTTGVGGCLNGTIAYHHDDPVTAVTAVTDSLGHATQFHLNDAYQVIREVNPLGNTTVSEWDRYDRLLTRTDPLGRTTHYTHDEAGNLVTITHPDGTQVSADYNKLRLPVTITHPDSAVWHHQYDQHGNLTARTDPAGATTVYTYNERGHLTAVTDALGHTRHITTNPAGLPVAVTDPLGAVTRYDRDISGRISAVTDPVGGVTRLGWTVEGKLNWRTLPDGATERFTYDGEGNLVEHIDALDQSTRLEYTHFDLPAVRRTPDGARLSFTYDTELRLTSVTNAQAAVWRYQYDSLGNLICETDFSNRTLSYAYDAAAQLIERTNGAGQTIQYRRDLLGNTVEQRFDDGTAATFGYSRAGHLLHAANPDAEITLERDPLGRVLAETCNGRTVTSRYDPLGRRVLRTTPTGAESTWSYDPNHQPVALHTAGHTLQFAYDPAGREIERHLDTAVTLTQTWDPNHQLETQALTANGPSGPTQPHPAHQTRLRQRRSYTYRSDGYLTRIDDQLSGSRRFILDPIGRITTVQGPGWTERYIYDPAGNIIHADWPTSANSREAENQGEREYAGTLIRCAGNTRYQYDTQGRIIQRQYKPPSAKSRIWHYTWDSDDRLAAITTPEGNRWHYCYDPFGRRIAKRLFATNEAIPLEQVDFTWDGAILAEQTRTGLDLLDAHTTTWHWEPGRVRPVGQTERSPLQNTPQQWVDDQFNAIITNNLGTPTELVDSAGAIVWHSQTSLWGITLQGTTGTIDCPLRFPGQYHDPETGLHYNYLRYYDPTTARYSSNDPFGLAPGPNPHTYVPNPTLWTDPFGLAGKCNTPEIFYRGMSNAEFRSLSETGRLSPRGESFVTQDLSYVEQLAARHPDKYETIVRFEMQPGTRQAMIDAGARSPGGLLQRAGLGHLPQVQKGMTDVVHIKAEGASINYGLRSGSVDIFNSRIMNFGAL
ncbi:MAG: DUF6531 domain-containing protein [Pseudonocardiaceae bacterium]